MVAKKDFYAAQHSEAIPIPNIEVMMLLKSFTSKGFVKETFNWGHYYWYLTAEGVTYLREYLALPEDIVPATLQQTALPTRPGFDVNGEKERKSAGPGGEFRGRPKREGYRA
jgi:small subunit ribosomal protein S10e